MSANLNNKRRIDIVRRMPPALAERVLVRHLQFIIDYHGRNYSLLFDGGVGMPDMPEIFVHPYAAEVIDRLMCWSETPEGHAWWDNKRCQRDIIRSI